MAGRLELCAGCRDDFYNHNRMGLNETGPGNAPRCWSLPSATIVRPAFVTHRDARPAEPGAFEKRTAMNSCWRGNAMYLVKPENVPPFARGYDGKHPVTRKAPRD